MADIFDQINPETKTSPQKSSGDIFDQINPSSTNKPYVPTEYDKRIKAFIEQNPTIGATRPPMSFGQKILETIKNIPQSAQATAQTLGNSPITLPFWSNLLQQNVYAAMHPEEGKKMLDQAVENVTSIPGSVIDRTKAFATHPVNEMAKFIIEDPVGYGLLMSSLIPGKPVELPNEAKTNALIDKSINKSIRPSVTGKATYSQTAKYNENAREAVKQIVANKDNLLLTNEYGEPVKKLPENLTEFSEAVEETKKSIFNKYDALSKEAGGWGGVIDLRDVTPELEQIANNKALQKFAPKTVSYAKARIKALSKDSILSTTDAQDSIKIMNNSLKSYYTNPTYDTASQAYVDSLIVNRMRQSLDSVIEKSAGPGYQELKRQYGSLKSIEKDLNRRMIVDARRNQKSLIDFSDIFSGSQVVHGLMTLNPAQIATGAAAKGIASYIKHQNSPNTAVKTMFKEVDKAMNKTAPPPKAPAKPVIGGAAVANQENKRKSRKYSRRGNEEDLNAF